MSVPGMNLLGMAMQLITPQAVVWYAATNRTQNAVGQWVSEFAAPEVIRGSWQPVDKAKYEQLGLDLVKKYFVFYASKSITPVERITSGDQLEYDDKMHQVLDDADWFTQDGWRGVMCVQLGDPP